MLLVLIVVVIVIPVLLFIYVLAFIVRLVFLVVCDVTLYFITDDTSWLSRLILSFRFFLVRIGFSYNFPTSQTNSAELNELVPIRSILGLRLGFFLLSDKCNYEFVIFQIIYDFETKCFCLIFFDRALIDICYNSNPSAHDVDEFCCHVRILGGFTIFSVRVLRSEHSNPLNHLVGNRELIIVIFNRHFYIDLIKF